jgi:hypothetical protein
MPALGLPTAMIGVLPQDHDTHILWRCQLQGPQGSRGKDHGAGIQSLLQKLQQLLACAPCKERLDNGLPV